MSLSTFSWGFKGFLPAEHEFLLLSGRAKQSRGVSCCPSSCATSQGSPVSPPELALGGAKGFGALQFGPNFTD